MASSNRPKRRAATKILDISSDSDDETPTANKYKPEDDDFIVEEDEKPIRKKPRTAKLTTKSSTTSEISTENIPKKRGRPKSKIEDETVPKKQKLTKEKTVSSTSSFENKENLNKPASSTFKSNPFGRQCPQPWNEPQLLAELQQIDYYKSANIIKSFNDEHTIPFMCRYRKELIGDLSPDQLRDIKITYNHILNIKTRAQSIMKILEKENVLNDDIKLNLLCAKSLDELEHLYAPYKPASKASLAERARSLGLQKPTEDILFGATINHNVNSLIDPKADGLESAEKITNGMQHIVSEMISKNSKVLDEIRQLQKYHKIVLQSNVIKSKTGEIKLSGAGESSKIKPKKSDEKYQKTPDPMKFEIYFDFSIQINYIKPHQILAINRGENLKILNVKLNIPDGFKMQLVSFIRKEYLSNGYNSKFRDDLVNSSFEECYAKKLIPLITRRTRGELTKLAEKASIEVFASNLKQLLLMSPVKGDKILGIDPGFSNGCKLALISECGDVLDSGVIYPHVQQSNSFSYGRQIAEMMSKHQCKLIALGNGTACRETEKWISELFAAGILNSSSIRYSIVTEQGASIYSCGEIAKKEFPKMDVNLISAVSIARRLNDPLCEFVKVEPKHLGVGMYQHDINDKLLTESLNEVVSECVSFVGVDINTASATLLRHVAGLTSLRAENIIKYRIENGPFKSRDTLKKVKQIGEKTFIQCAGFIRIEPKTAGVKEYNYNVLDSTWVHPESYELAGKILKKCNLNQMQIGSDYAIKQIKLFASKNSIDDIAKEFGVPNERITCLLDALQRELFRDYRCDFDKKPLFKQGLTKMSDLQAGTCVTGAVTNITHFGCFVDIGVETNGLIHSSQLYGMKPNIGDRVAAEVVAVDLNRRRIQLKLQSIL